MARAQSTRKPSVNLASNLASPGLGKSRIRRDPPPVKLEKVVVDPEEREQRDVIFGILTFALVIFVITLAFASYGSWSPANYTVQM